MPWKSERKSEAATLVPTKNPNGPNMFISPIITAHLDQRAPPVAPDARTAAVLRRARIWAGELDPQFTVLDFVPRRRDYAVCGESGDLGIIVADFLARNERTANPQIIATGSVPGFDGKVVEVGGFEEKLDLLLTEATPGSRFIYPKKNKVESVEVKLARLETERGVTCIAIESLEEIKFLWDPPPPERWWQLVAAGFVALAVVVFIAWPPPPPPSPPPADSSIFTAGEKGAYHTQFCPVIAAALSKAQFGGYKCTPSKGTLENIARVLNNPTSVGFVQFDVYTTEAIKHGEAFKRLTVIRDDLACEHLWMVTKNPDLKDYTSVLNNAPRIPFILPSEQSGSAATFAFLQANTPNQLGRVPEANKRYVADATELLNKVASSDNGAVGFFVQFHDPKNENIKLMKRKLNIIPVWSEEILRIKLNEKRMYLERAFEIRWTDGVIGSQWIDAVIGWLIDEWLVKVEATTTCTRVAVITGTPEAVEELDPRKRKNHEDLIQIIERMGL
jgi:hypothetical protein